jgi:restriction endonuclease Mrr
VPYGLYVTTSSYTTPALKLAQEHRDRVRLVDGPQLVAMARALAVR